ncbi:hypothetical protein BDR26DRAFT_930601 [Obelidium mucronatum]|nr:hypothetical protein BDR26DRAFT_930601 [Obelidium mucronatum]
MKLPTILATIVLVLASCPPSISASSQSVAVVPPEPSSSSSSHNGPTDCSHMFIPTTDWKVIHPDECIPPGLHIRINFETGVKEAKLKGKDDDDAQDSAAGTAISVPAVVVGEQKGASESGASGYTIVKESRKQKESNDDDASKPYGSLLSEDLNDQDLQNHLEFLEQEVSDIEEGTRLMETKFLRHRLIQIISTHPDASVRSLAARVYAGSVSNNLMAQQAALDTIDALLESIQKEDNTQVAKSLVHAVACLVRGNKVSARVFWKHGGFKVLRGLFDGAKWRSEKRVQNKVKDLVNDLFDVDLLVDGSVQDQEGLKLMAQGGFCDGSISDEGIAGLCAKYMSSVGDEL